MSSINFQRNTFLEKEELNRMQTYWGNDEIISILNSQTNVYGVVGQSSLIPTHAGPGAADLLNISPGKIIFKNDGYFCNPNIAQMRIDEFSIGENYIYAIKDTSPYEEGVFKITTSGILTGSSSIAMNSYLRGEENDVPTSVLFYKGGSPIFNGQIFKVKSVSETQAQMLNQSGSFEFSQNMRMVVLGTIPLNYQFSSEQLQGLYLFNRIKFIASETLINDDEHILIGSASVSATFPRFDSVIDLRKDFWELSGSGASDFDYIVKTVDDLLALNNNTTAQNVLIKAGTYNILATSTQDLIHIQNNVQKIVGENGAKIVLQHTTHNSYLFVGNEGGQNKTIIENLIFSTIGENILVNWLVGHIEEVRNCKFLGNNPINIETGYSGSLVSVLKILDSYFYNIAVSNSNNILGCEFNAPGTTIGLAISGCSCISNCSFKNYSFIGNDNVSNITISGQVTIIGGNNISNVIFKPDQFSPTPTPNGYITNVNGISNVEIIHPNSSLALPAFYQCIMMNSCTTNLPISSCTKVSQCRAKSFSNSYASVSSSSTYACADTANGGFNSIFLA